MMLARSVEGIIAVDTPIEEDLPFLWFRSQAQAPQWSHQHRTGPREGRAPCAVAPEELGHRKIAFIKGQAFSSDTEQRWQAIVDVARRWDIESIRLLVVQLQSPEPGPGPGMEVTRQLLQYAAALHRDLRIQRRYGDWRHSWPFARQGCVFPRCLRARLRRCAYRRLDQQSAAHHNHQPLRAWVRWRRARCWDSSVTIFLIRVRRQSLFIQSWWCANPLVMWLRLASCRSPQKTKKPSVPLNSRLSESPAGASALQRGFRQWFRVRRSPRVPHPRLAIDLDLLSVGSSNKLRLSICR